MGSLTIRLDADLDAQLARLAKRQHRPKSEVVRELLRKQLAIARFRELRSRAVPAAEQAGFLVDEDVFDQVS